MTKESVYIVQVQQGLLSILKAALAWARLTHRILLLCFLQEMLYLLLCFSVRQSAHAQHLAVASTDITQEISFNTLVQLQKYCVKSESMPNLTLAVKFISSKCEKIRITGTIF